MSSILNIAMIVAVVMVALLILFGIAALWVRSTVWATICEVIAHGGFAFGGALFLYFLVPKFKRVFEDFGTELPTMTRIVIAISDVTVNYWYLFPFAIFPGLVIDALAFATFHRRSESRYVARTFSAVVTLGLLATALSGGYALFSAQAGLLQQMP